jgi:hypothetical protein
VRPAVATFPPHSTPTSVVISPFEADTLLVALWLSGEVVQLPLTYSRNHTTLGIFRSPRNLETLMRYISRCNCLSQPLLHRLWSLRRHYAVQVPE